MLLLLPVLWLSILLVRVPAGSALTVPALFLDRVIVVSSVVVLPATVLLLLVLPLPGARAAAVVGGAVSAIVGLPTLLAAIDPPREPLPTALAVASVICGAALVSILLFRSFKGRRWRLSLLAPLALLPALLPAVQFWQATSYTPSQLITSVTPEVRVVVQRLDPEERLGTVEVTLDNSGDVRASLFTSQVVFCFSAENDWRKFHELTMAQLRADEDCAYAQVVSRNADLDAQTTQTYSIPWRAPASKSFAIVWMISEYVREDRMRLVEEALERDSAPGCLGNVTVFRLQPDTRFKGVVQPTRLLTFDREEFYLSYEGAPLCATETNQELRTELGVRRISVYRGDWLTDPPGQD
ncbi:hypothetical protein ACI792_00780 [Blastococcus sp. SYSU DS0669]